MNDPLNNIAHIAAAEVCNLLAADTPGGKAEQFSRVYALLVTMLFMACEEQAERWKTPSSN